MKFTANKVMHSTGEFKCSDIVGMYSSEHFFFTAPQLLGCFAMIYWSGFSSEPYEHFQQRSEDLAQSCCKCRNWEVVEITDV